jgi:hypothetical protein
VNKNPYGTSSQEIEKSISLKKYSKAYHKLHHKTKVFVLDFDTNDFIFI